MTSIEFVPLTDDIAEKFWGTKPAVTIKAVVAIEDGEVIGVAGVYRIGLAYMLFSDVTPRFEVNKRNFVLGVRAVRKLIDSLKLPVYAHSLTGNNTVIKHTGAMIWPG